MSSPSLGDEPRASSCGSTGKAVLPPIAVSWDWYVASAERLRLQAAQFGWRPGEAPTVAALISGWRARGRSLQASAPPPPLRNSSPRKALWRFCPGPSRDHATPGCWHRPRISHPPTLTAVPREVHPTAASHPGGARRVAAPPPGVEAPLRAG